MPMFYNPIYELSNFSVVMKSTYPRLNQAGITLANAASNSSDLANMLQREGITHLLINAGSEHYQAWLKSLSPESQSKFEGLLSHNAQLLFEDNKEYAPNDRSWVQVYKIVTDPTLKN